ncbi:cation-translocating P-type ATPase [Atopobiaceae bacterium 24-176]
MSACETEPCGVCGCEGHEHGRGCCEGHDHGHDAPAPSHELSGAADLTFKVADLDCPNCARNVEEAVRSLPEVADARLTYATASLAVVSAPGVPPATVERAVLDAVRSCGEDLELTEEQVERLQARRGWFAEHRAAVLLGASGALIACGALSEVAASPAAVWLYTGAALAGLAFILPLAAASVARRKADMNVLMSIAVIGALVMGLVEALGGHVEADTFRDAAIVIFLDQVGEWLEGWSMRRSRGSVEGLMELAPETAHVVGPDGQTKDVSLAGVEEGQEVRVLPGERVPLDGMVVAGDSSFDEAPVTGESVPQDKGPGAVVYGGSLNTVAPVTVRVTARADSGTLARIVSMVQGAQAQKAPYEAFVDRFAAVYTPAVVAVAAAVGIGVPLCLTLVSALGMAVAPDWGAWIWRALTLLVIACPCALVISTPVSFVSAISRAARMGVLVKGGAYFDIGSKVRAVAFDKTGTLTAGAPEVVSVMPLGGMSRERVLALAAALERESTHPLAAAVRAAAEAGASPVLEASDVRETAGNGMTGTVDGVPVLVGKPAFARSAAGLGAAAEEAVDAASAAGATALVVVADGTPAGVVAVADSVRATTPEAVARLHAMGIRDTVMLTGDNRRVAAVVAGEVGVSDVAAELLPDDKVARVEALRARGLTVAMVGDGINDAPALAAADLGVTMGAAASDTALEVADVALLSGDVEHLPSFFSLSRRCMAVVRENIAFAIAVKVAVLVLAVLGVAGMGAAIFADTGVALIVVLNGMRLMTPWETRF